MKIATLRPTAENTYKIAYTDSDSGQTYGDALYRSQEQERERNIEGACNTRLQAFQHFMELIPDATNIELEWGDRSSRDAMLLVHFSAIDHFLIGDFEITAAMLEMLLELDPEDHLNASKILAYAYIALEEWDNFDEVINDVSDKYADKKILALWSEYRRNGKIPEGEYRHFKRFFAPYFSEFIADDHQADEAYLEDIESDRPSREASARELWLQTEHLWRMFPGFIEALQQMK